MTTTQAIKTIYSDTQGSLYILKTGEIIFIDKWHCMIAFPPCTFITVTGARWMYNKDGSINNERMDNQIKAIDFVKRLYYSKIEYIAIENPIGVLSSKWIKPTQIIQPYYFGDEAQKKTCLWLKNLPPLYHNGKLNLFDSDITHVCKGEMVTTTTGKKFSKWYWDTSKGLGFLLPIPERDIIEVYDGDLV